MKITNFWMLLVTGLLLLGGCDPTDNPHGGGVDPIDIKPKATGTLEIDFKVPYSYSLPPNKVLRADLSIAKGAEELYKGRFMRVANVYNNKAKYTFELEPGTYYYQAGIVCIAEGDSCSASNFPGGQWGMKWSIGVGVVTANNTTTVVPQFTN